MRKIEVDVDVFSAIWSLREPGEANENDILTRCLRELNEFKNSSSDNGGKEQFDEKGQHTAQSFKVRWVDDVLAALRKLGGEADLASIYEHVRQARNARGVKGIKHLEATIRRTIEEHSSDSKNWGRNQSARDHFALVSRGRWKLR